MKNLSIVTIFFLFIFFHKMHEEPVVSSTSEKNSTFYVSVNGDDSGAGSKENPWKSPAFACKQLSPGDTLIILPGRYILDDFPKDILAPPSGSKNDWITIKGSNKKHRPVLIGENDLLSAISLSNVHFLKIENLEITSNKHASGSSRWFRDGISAVDESCSNIELKNLYIHHIDEFGLNAKDIEHLKVTKCVFEYCGFGAIGGPEGETGGMRYVEISNSRLSYSGHYYQGGDGNDRPYDRPDGFGNEESAGPIVIKDTTVEHNYGDGIDSKSRNTSVERCVVANNSCDGVKLWGDNSKISNTLIYGTGDGVGGDSPWAGIVIGTNDNGAKFEIMNVTLHDNPERKAFSMYVQYDEPDIPITVVLENSIISNAYGVAYFGPSVDLVCNNNIFNRKNAKVQVTAFGRDYEKNQLEQLGSNNLSLTPEFIRPTWGIPGDYHLKRKSPAIDSGRFVSARTKDLEGVSRPQAIGFDIGAYEWNKSVRSIRKPANLTAKVKSHDQILLQWKTKESGLNVTIERSVAIESGWSEWQPVAMLKAKKGKYLDRGLDPRTKYRYRLFAHTFSRASLFSKTITVSLD